MVDGLTDWVSKSALIICVSLGTFFAPITSAFITAIVVVILDTLTKVIVVGKTKGIGAISSKKLFKVVPKLIFYFVFIILAEILHDYVDIDVPFVKLTLVAIIGIEVYSIDENFEELTGFSFVKKILTFTKQITRYKNEKAKNKDT